MALPDVEPAPGTPDVALEEIPENRRMWLSPLNQRRWRNFRRNGRAYWSLIIFSVLFGLSLFAEFIANDKPILVSYRGELYMPIFNFYPETTFGGDLGSEAKLLRAAQNTTSMAAPVCTTSALVSEFANFDVKCRLRVIMTKAILFFVL